MTCNPHDALHLIRLGRLAERLTLGRPQELAEALATFFRAEAVVVGCLRMPKSARHATNGDGQTLPELADPVGTHIGRDGLDEQRLRRTLRMAAVLGHSTDPKRATARETDDGEPPVWLWSGQLAELGEAVVSIHQPAKGEPDHVSACLVVGRADASAMELLRLIHVELADALTPLSPGLAALQSLRPLQRQTLELLLAGLTEPQISDQTGMSGHTVHSHVKRIYRLAGVKSRGELMSRLLGGSGVGSEPAGLNEAQRGV